MSRVRSDKWYLTQPIHQEGVCVRVWVCVPLSHTHTQRVGVCVCVCKMVTLHEVMSFSIGSNP